MLLGQDTLPVEEGDFLRIIRRLHTLDLSNRVHMNSNRDPDQKPDQREEHHHWGDQHDRADLGHEVGRGFDNLDSDPDPAIQAADPDE